MSIRQHYLSIGIFDQNIGDRLTAPERRLNHKITILFCLYYVFEKVKIIGSFRKY